MQPLYPIALSLQDRRCVVVGGGTVATRRVAGLLESGAAVTVITPAVGGVIATLAESGRITLMHQPYSAIHLTGAFLVIAATDNSAVNETVIQDAKGLGALSCDAHSAERGDFVIPAVVHRGRLLLAVTTGGASPALAARIARDLENQYGPEYAELVSILGEARREAMSIVVDNGIRRALFKRLAEDESLLTLIREGRAQEARKRALECILPSSD